MGRLFKVLLPKRKNAKDVLGEPKRSAGEAGCGAKRRNGRSSGQEAATKRGATMNLSDYL